MSVTSNLTVNIVFTGDASGTEVITAAENTASPGSIQIVTLASGFNSISVPSGGTTPTGLTILPPSGNQTAITLKGITGDTGLRIHNTNPTLVSVDPSVTTIGLTAASIVTGVRLYWS